MEENLPAIQKAKEEEGDDSVHSFGILVFDRSDQWGEDQHAAASKGWDLADLIWSLQQELRGRMRGKKGPELKPNQSEAFEEIFDWINSELHCKGIDVDGMIH